MRRSVNEAELAQRAARGGRARSASGWPWKLPPEMTSPLVGEDQRVVGDGVELVGEVSLALVERVARRRRAPAGCSAACRVLHAPAVGVAGDDLRCRASSSAQARRGAPLAGLRPQRVDALVERRPQRRAAPRG